MDRALLTVPASRQVVGDDGMDVDHHDSERPGDDVLLMDEVGVEGDEDGEGPFGCCDEFVIVVIGPSLVLGRDHFVHLRQLGAKGMGNVVVEKDPHA
jgi:hypothetical protein